MSDSNRVPDLDRLRAGDKDEWAALVYGQVGRQLRRYFAARAWIDVSKSEEDLLHDLFIRAWRRRATIPDELLPWLFTIAINLCRSEARRLGVIRRVLGRRGRDDVGIEHAERGVAGRVASDAVARAMADEVVRELASLTESERVAYTLVDLGGLSYEEAGEVLGIPAKRLKSRVERARRRLRERLGPVEG